MAEVVEFTGSEVFFMRPSRSIILLFFTVLSSLAVYAQRSPVFLEQCQSEGDADRPKPRIRPLETKHFQTPQTIGTSNSNFPNINVSQTLFADQNETSISVNPSDGLNIVVGANDYRSLNTLWYYTSLDGGATWKSEALPTDQALYFATDPSVAFGPDGIVYYGNGRIDAGGSPYPINDVVCYRSTTKGQTWQAPVRVVLDSTGPGSATKLADKYYIAVAPTAPGPLPPKVYMAWVEYESGKSRIVVSRSADGGASWSSPVGVSAFGKFQAPVPVVAMSGEVCVVFIDLDTTKREILFAKSTDGGTTFSSPKKIANYQNLGPMYPPGSTHPHPIIKGHLRVNSFPSISIDRSSKHFNRIYTTWAGKGQDGRHHIYLSKSDDMGSSWSEALPIEVDKSAINTDKFFPWIATDPTTGNVGICFYDSRMDAPANQLTDLFLGISEDGGESFSVRRISDVSFNPSVTSSTDSILTTGDTLAFFGDYNGLSNYHGVWYPAWTDSRVGYDQDIYIAIVNPGAPEAVNDLQVSEEPTTHFPILTWAHSGLTTFGTPLTSYVFRIKRSDGASIDLPATSRTFRDSSVSAATSYKYEVTVVAGDLESRTQEVLFTPFAVRKPQTPVPVTSRAEADGFFLRFRIPDKNVIGDTIHGLDYLYYLIDDEVFDSFKLSDGLRGATLERSFTVATGYHKVQLAATTASVDGVVSSDTSEARWLYAGTPRTEYSESFEGSKDIFSIYSWDTTSGSLPSHFVNDSLPNIPYRSGVNSWFLLPPIRVSSDIHTLEFDYIALVASGDSALVEFSLDNGISYFGARRYDRSSEPLKWGTSLGNSSAASDSIPLKAHIGKDAITRFRLSGTNATNEDGWFIDNIRFTDKLTVMHDPNDGTFLRMISRNAVGTNAVVAELTLAEGGFVSLATSDILGRSTEMVLDHKYIPEGRYLIDIPAAESGIYFIAAVIRSAGAPVRTLHERFVISR